MCLFYGALPANLKFFFFVIDMQYLKQVCRLCIAARIDRKSRQRTLLLGGSLFFSNSRHYAGAGAVLASSLCSAAIDEC